MMVLIIKSFVSWLVYEAKGLYGGSCVYDLKAIAVRIEKTRAGG